jgi:hypothetical protein
MCTSSNLAARERLCSLSRTEISDSDNSESLSVPRAAWRAAGHDKR